MEKKKADILARMQVFLDGMEPGSEDDILSIVDSKLEPFITGVLSRMRNRRNLTLELDDLIETIYGQEGNKYFYNPSINAYYEVVGEKLVLLHSDKILSKLKQYVPPSMYKNRYYILKSLRQKLKNHNDLLKWIPPYMVVQNNIDLVEKIFLDRNSAYHLMYTVGSIVLRKVSEEESLTDIHLWSGGAVDDAVSALDQMVFEIFRIRSGVFPGIKKEYHVKYPFSRIKYLHFPNANAAESLRTLHEQKEVFLMSCVSVYNNYPKSMWLDGDSIVSVFKRYDTKDAIFSDYYDSNVLQDHQQENGVLLYEEIVDDFNDFLQLKSLPLNIITQTDLRAMVGAKFEAVKHGQVTYFAGKLATTSKYDRVREFLTDATTTATAISTVGYEDYVRWYKEKRNDTEYSTPKQFAFFSSSTVSNASSATY
jgi:hypothetical protein